MSGGNINPTEMVAALINQKESDRGRPAVMLRKMIDGSMTVLVHDGQRSLLLPETAWAVRR